MEEGKDALSSELISMCAVCFGLCASLGTGKTTVAKLYAGVLSELGLLSKGEVILKTASDFVGSVLGESEEKTNAILEDAKGSCLIIDEAYALHDSIAGGFRANVID